MGRDRLILAGLAALGVAVLAVIYVMTRPAPVPAPGPPAVSGADGDQPGPYLVISVGGEARGTVRIDLNEAAAPEHTKRMLSLARSGAYDNVVFHRVIDGFMAQTGDVKYGRAGQDDYLRAGGGGSDRPDLKAEFGDIPFERGVVGMARSRSPDSANSQFFIMFAPAPHLTGKYTVVGRVTEGMDVVDALKRGGGPNGAVRREPDVMLEVRVDE